MACFINFLLFSFPIYLVILFSAFIWSKYQNLFCSKLLFGFQNPNNSVYSMSFLFLCSLFFHTPSLLISFLLIFHLLRNRSLQASFHILDCLLEVPSRHTKIHSLPHIHSTFSWQVVILIFLAPNVYILSYIFCC